MGCKALVLAALSAQAFTPGSREHALARWVASEGGFVGDAAAPADAAPAPAEATLPTSAGGDADELPF